MWAIAAAAADGSWGHSHYGHYASGILHGQVLMGHTSKGDVSGGAFDILLSNVRGSMTEYAFRDRAAASGVVSPFLAGNKERPAAYSRATT